MNHVALQNVLDSPGSSETSHLIIVVDPHPTIRGRCTKSIASLYVFQLLWNRHTTGRASEMVNLYYLFQSVGFTGSAAGWAFESLMHHSLRKGLTIQLSSIQSHSTKDNIHYDNYTASISGTNPWMFQLPVSDEHDLQEGAKLVVGHYYRPQSSNFPTIDSLFLIRPSRWSFPVLLMFWIAQNRDGCDVNTVTLERVAGLQLPRGTQKYYVVVTPEDIKPDIRVPKAYFTDRELRKKKLDKIFPVFHFRVVVESVLPPGAE